MSDEKGVAGFKTPVPAQFIQDEELNDLEMVEYEIAPHADNSIEMAIKDLNMSQVSILENEKPSRETI